MNPSSSNMDPVNPFKPTDATFKPGENIGNVAPAPESLPGAMPVDDTVTTPATPIVPAAPIVNTPKLEPTPIFKAPPAPIPVPASAPAPKITQNVPPVLPKLNPDFFPKPFMNPLAANTNLSTNTAQAISDTPKTEAVPEAIPRVVILPATENVPLVDNTPKDKPPTSVLKNIRTYESDVADILAHNDTSRASMAISESVKRGQGETISNVSPAEKSHLGRNITIVVISLVLIAAGAIAGYYLYSQSPLGKTAPVVTTPRAPSAPVNYESQVAISVDGLNRAGIIKRVRDETAKPIAVGTIKEIVMTEIKDGQTYRVSAPEMANIMTITAPDMITRTLAPAWMLGVYAGPEASGTSATGNGNSAFVIVTTNLFQNAFAGMLGWEAAIPEDLKDIIMIVDPKNFTPALKGAFSDQIIKNKDVRAFVTNDGRTALVYSFVDNSTLVITDNAETLSAIITRLENKTFVR